MCRESTARYVQHYSIVLLQERFGKSQKDREMREERERTPENVCPNWPCKANYLLRAVCSFLSSRLNPHFRGTIKNRLPSTQPRRMPTACYKWSHGLIELSGISQIFDMGIDTSLHILTKLAYFCGLCFYSLQFPTFISYEKNEKTEKLL